MTTSSVMRLGPKIWTDFPWGLIAATPRTGRRRQRCIDGGASRFAQSVRVDETDQHEFICTWLSAIGTTLKANHQAVGPAFVHACRKASSGLAFLSAASKHLRVHDTSRSNQV